MVTLDVIAQSSHNIFQFSHTETGVRSRRNLSASIDGDAALAGEDVDSFPRPVMTLGVATIRHDWEHARHQHRKAQLLYAVRGIINCEVEDGVWIVPPLCAIWIPAGVSHAARGSGGTECYCLFVEPSATPGLPQNCCSLGVSPLLRELISKAAGFPRLYPINGPEERLVATLLDELVAAPVEGLHLPLPRNAKLKRLADLLLADPADKASIGEWAGRIGMSERSMTRLLREEIGMSFGHWRRQLHVILALQRLTKGDSVQEVAFDLGYENASGFVTMFRKTVGKPPGRYLYDRRNTESTDDESATPTIALPDTV